VRLADPDLPRRGPAGLDDRGGLTPNQLCPAGPEAAVATIGQLIRLAVERAVATFHRLGAERSAGADVSQLNRAEQRREGGGQAQVQAEALTFGDQVVEGAEFEESGHGGCLSHMILWTPRCVSSAAVLSTMTVRATTRQEDASMRIDLYGLMF